MLESFLNHGTVPGTGENINAFFRWGVHCPVSLSLNLTYYLSIVLTERWH
jgi:hypothetical protein